MWQELKNAMFPMVELWVVKTISYNYAGQTISLFIF